MKFVWCSINLDFLFPRSYFIRPNSGFGDTKMTG